MLQQALSHSDAAVHNHSYAVACQNKVGGGEVTWLVVTHRLVAQEVYNVSVAIGSCQVERSSLVVVTGVWGHAIVDEQLHVGCVPIHTGFEEGPCRIDQQASCHSVIAATDSTGWSVIYLRPSLPPPLTHSPSLQPSVPHSLAYPLTHPPTRSLTHPLTHPVTHPSTHSLTHFLIQTLVEGSLHL